jgi:hypothetical protein
MQTQAARNRRAGDVWALFAEHRERLLALIPPDTAGGTLAVLGAGKCDDLDLPRLARHFRAIHLIDLDGEALERARARQPASVREAIQLHGGVDLTGLFPLLDEWDDAFPDDAGLLDAVVEATGTVTAALGGPFDVTLSTCVLSQLMVPFQDAWAAPPSTWSRLSAALTAIHVAVLARTTAAGGAASLIFDVLSSAEAPMLQTLRGRPSEELQAAVDAWTRASDVALEPDPRLLLARICELGVAAPEPGPHLSAPWLWDTGTALHLVYALSFRKL